MEMQQRLAFNADHPELACLRRLSARLGRDPLLVQASSGNTSVKLDGVLWIKASGKWLIHAEHDEIFVPVDLAETQRSFQHSETIGGEWISGRGTRLQGSIETSMHAVLPYKVVVHAHSINTIAWAIRGDGPEQLTTRLDGLNWQWIPYVRSGVPLARKIEEGVARSPGTNVFVLGNHGLVVCGDSCDAVEDLLWEVERRVAVHPRPAPEPKYSVLQNINLNAEWCIPEIQAIHALGTDGTSRRIVAGGALFPCQAIFLTGRPCVLSPGSDAARLGQFEQDRVRQEPFVMIEGAGVVYKKSLTLAQREILKGLVHVLQRTPPTAPIRYLSESEIETVLLGDAHQYRTLAEQAS